MELSKKLLDGLETLSMLRLTEEEKETVRGELADMLGFMQQLSDLDLGDAPVQNQGCVYVDSLRLDTVQPSLPADELMQNASETADGFFTVPAVME